MDNFDTLKSAWNKGKDQQSALLSSEEMQQVAVRNQRESLRFHLGNVATLGLTVVGLLLFFNYLAPVQWLLSRVGVVLMIGGLITRIVIELISWYKFNRISYDNTIFDAANKTGKFYSWRKKVHGPVTITIILLYSIGFYLITPEFLQYIDLVWVIIMDIGYIIIAIVLILVIRKSIRKEMLALEQICNIKSQISSGDLPS